jgi:hypothetical protein
MGRTSSHLTVNFDGPPDLIGRLVRLRILRVKANSLDGGPAE